ncbi:MAG: 6-phosphogluconolactonase [Paraglaciecola sp.]|uniref:6-phosphogluconolactonase n=1 Tax=Paraglaciecola sp. TaxID=1920173 RepID=UPI00329A0146
MALTKSKFRTPEQLNLAFTRKISKLLRDGIEENGRASLIVSGGRTPAALFEALSKISLAWDLVDISLADERWVDNANEASNEKMLREKLLINNAVNANFFPLKTHHADATEADQQCASNLQDIHKPFDVVILGMGEDGHTASLFPCSEQISEGLDLESGQSYIAVQPTTAPNQRISLTLPALLNSQQIFLHLTGDSKKEVLDIALSGDNEMEMPIRAVLNNADVELLWAP